MVCWKVSLSSWKLKRNLDIRPALWYTGGMSIDTMQIILNVCILGLMISVFGIIYSFLSGIQAATQSKESLIGHSLHIGMWLGFGFLCGLFAWGTAGDIAYLSKTIIP